MFQALRQGAPFYVLEKVEQIRLQTGLVDSVSAPRPKFTSYPPYSQEVTVDIKVKIGESVMEFNGVPGNLSIANFGTSNIVISESKDDMMREVDGMLQTSKQVLASIDHHQRVVESCETIAKELNPVFAKEQERDNALDALKSEMNGIKDSIQQILRALPVSEKQ